MKPRASDLAALLPATMGPLNYEAFW